MLLKLTGSSCAGKSTLARAASLPESVVVRDFDEVGVPEQPGACWRHEHTEWWAQQALAYEQMGKHLLLAGQSPIGEVLATPSAVELDGVAVCLVDVSDEVRVQRLRRRDGARSNPSSERDYVRWAEWHRRHAEDPRHERGVIVRPDCVAMKWSRWSDWSKGDPRWQVDVIDTTGIPLDDAVELLRAWVERQLAAWKAGALPLRRGWHI